MIVKFYTISKKNNSTKTPANAGVAFNVKLKSPCDVLNPRLELQGANLNYNYCYIEKFHRFYYVSNWTYIGPHWEIMLTVDILASWKNNIGNSQKYILRSSSNFDRRVRDDKFPALSEITYAQNTFDTPFTRTVAGGTYVLGVAAPGGSDNMISYFCLTTQQFAAFTAYMYDVDNYSAFDFPEEEGNVIIDFFRQCKEFIKDIFKSSLNPMQYIVSCMYLPFEYMNVVSSFIKFGWWETPIDCTRIAGYFHNVDIIDIPIPTHPQYSERGNWLNESPYAQYCLYLMPFGAIPIDPAQVRGCAFLRLRFAIDVVSGVARVEICARGRIEPSPIPEIERIITYAEATIGVPIQLAQYNNNFTAQASAIFDAAWQTVAQNPVGAANGIVNMVTTPANNVRIQGVSGTRISALQIEIDGSTQKGCLNAYFRSVAPMDNAQMGRPLCAIRTISAIPGFIICDNGEIVMEGTDYERNVIKTYLEGGFYYE